MSEGQFQIEITQTQSNLQQQISNMFQQDYHISEEHQDDIKYLLEQIQDQTNISVTYQQNQETNGDKKVLINFVEMKFDIFKMRLFEDLSVVFTKCQFQVLDYSESEQQQFDDIYFLGNIIGKLIMPTKVKILFLRQQQCLNNITEMTLHDIETIISLSIFNWPSCINCLEAQITGNDKNDFSQFSNLKKVCFKNISNNILIPNILDKLEIAQTEEFRILNDFISCNDLNLTNFDLTNLRIQQCIQLTLNDIFVSQENFNLSTIKNLKSVILADIQNNIWLPDILDELQLTQKSNCKLLNTYLSCNSVEITNYTLNTTLQNCTKINLKNCISTNLSMENLDQEMENVNLEGCQLGCLDFSESNWATFNQNFGGENSIEKIILPKQLQDIVITDKVQQLAISTNYSVKSMEIINCPSRIYSNQRVRNNMNSQNESSKVLDLSQFCNMVTFNLADSTFSSIIFGPGLEEVNISNSVHGMFDYMDFSDCLLLKKAILNNLDVKEVFMSKNNVQFVDSKIKTINLSQAIQSSIDMQLFYKAYKNCCTHIALSNQIGKDRKTIYSVATEEIILDVSRAVILAVKISEIYQKINQLMYE